MREKYVVYVKHTATKLFETSDFIKACEFVDELEHKNKDSDYYDRYEIIKVVM